MTLVTVEFTGKKISISADTLLTVTDSRGLQRDGNKNNAVPGGLKLYILSANYCLCFAGTYVTGVALLRRIFKKGIQNNLNLLKAEIQRTHYNSLRNYHTETDFLLCLRGERKCLIWRQGGYVETKENCFIGNSEAYNSIDESTTDRRSISDLADHPDFPTIGGVILSVSDNHRFFYYSYLVSFYVQKTDNAHSPNGFQWVTVAVYSPFPRLGSYFVGGKFGCLYDPLHYDDAITIKADSIESFKSKANLENASHIVIGTQEKIPNTPTPLGFHDAGNKTS